jgi:nucleoside-diphosphate-sugar epimerase
MKTILVTGSEGFIGSHLCYALDALGYDVLEADRKNGPDLTKGCKNFPDADIVIHLAAFNGTKYFYQQPYDVIRDNVMSTQYLLDRYAGKVERFIFSGSCESYAGTVDKFGWAVPTEETVPLTVSDVTNPRWSYGGSKILNELQVQAAHQQFGQDFTTIRYHNIYGPGQQDHFIQEFYQRAKQGDLTLKGWDNTRSFMFITDAIRATIAVMNSDACKNQTINIGVNDERTIKEVAELILNHAKIEGDLILESAPEGSVSRRQADVTKLHSLIDFKAEVDLEQGIQVTLDSL